MLTVQSELRSEGKHASLRTICSVLGVPRSTFYYRPSPTAVSRPVDLDLQKAMYQIIQQHPTYGLRRVRAMLYRELGQWVNRKRIHRIIKLNHWQIRRRRKGNRPRARGWAARPDHPNELWEIDATHIMTTRGWCHLVAIIDTYDRTIVGWRLSDSGSAAVATGAVEDALRARCIDPYNNDLTIRSDNGLIFGSKAFTGVAHRYNVSQEYITPYTPEQNGMIERFFRTAKEEVFWQYRIHDPDDAFTRFAEWIEWYDEGRPHSALGYLSPSEFRSKQAA